MSVKKGTKLNRKPMTGRRGGLTRRAMALLAAAPDSGWISSADLAAALDVVPARFGSLLGTSLAFGLVERRLVSSRRAEWRITPAGREALDVALQRLHLEAQQRAGRAKVHPAAASSTCSAVAAAVAATNKTSRMALLSAGSLPAVAVDALMALPAGETLSGAELARLINALLGKPLARTQNLASRLKVAIARGCITVARPNGSRWLQYSLGPQAPAMVQAMAARDALRATKGKPPVERQRGQYAEALRAARAKPSRRVAAPQAGADGDDPNHLDEEMRALQLRRAAWQPLPNSTAARAMAALGRVRPGELLESIHLAAAIGLDDPRDIDTALGPAVLAGRVRAYPASRDVRRTVYSLVRGPGVAAGNAMEVTP